MPTWKVTNIRPGSRLNERNLPVRTMVASFTVGAWGPFEVEIDEDKFTSDELEKQVAARAAHIARFQAGA